MGTFRFWLGLLALMASFFAPLGTAGLPPFDFENFSFQKDDQDFPSYGPIPEIPAKELLEPPRYPLLDPLYENPRGLIRPGLAGMLIQREWGLLEEKLDQQRKSLEAEERAGRKAGLFRSLEALEEVGTRLSLSEDWLRDRPESFWAMVFRALVLRDFQHEVIHRSYHRKMPPAWQKVLNQWSQEIQAHFLAAAKLRPKDPFLRTHRLNFFLDDHEGSRLDAFVAAQKSFPEGRGPLTSWGCVSNFETYPSLKDRFEAREKLLAVPAPSPALEVRNELLSLTPIQITTQSYGWDEFSPVIQGIWKKSRDFLHQNPTAFDIAETMLETAKTLGHQPWTRQAVRILSPSPRLSHQVLVHSLREPSPKSPEAWIPLLRRLTQEDLQGISGDELRNLLQRLRDLELPKLQPVLEAAWVRIGLDLSARGNPVGPELMVELLDPKFSKLCEDESRESYAWLRLGAQLGSRWFLGVLGGCQAALAPPAELPLARNLLWAAAERGNRDSMGLLGRWMLQYAAKDSERFLAEFLLREADRWRQEPYRNYRLLQYRDRMEALAAEAKPPPTLDSPGATSFFQPEWTLGEKSVHPRPIQSLFLGRHGLTVQAGGYSELSHWNRHTGQILQTEPVREPLPRRASFPWAPFPPIETSGDALPDSFPFFVSDPATSRAKETPKAPRWPQRPIALPPGYPPQKGWKAPLRTPEGWLLLTQIEGGQKLHWTLWDPETKRPRYPIQSTTVPFGIFDLTWKLEGDYLLASTIQPGGTLTNHTSSIWAKVYSLPSGGLAYSLEGQGRLGPEAKFHSFDPKWKIGLVQGNVRGSKSNLNWLREDFSVVAELPRVWKPERDFRIDRIDETTWLSSRGVAYQGESKDSRSPTFATHKLLHRYYHGLLDPNSVAVLDPTQKWIWASHRGQLLAFETEGEKKDTLVYPPVGVFSQLSWGFSQEGDTLQTLHPGGYLEAWSIPQKQAKCLSSLELDAYLPPRLGSQPGEVVGFNTRRNWVVHDLVFLREKVLSEKVFHPRTTRLSPHGSFLVHLLSKPGRGPPRLEILDRDGGSKTLELPPGDVTFGVDDPENPTHHCPVTISEDGNRIALYRNQRPEVWDVATGEKVSPPLSMGSIFLEPQSGAQYLVTDRFQKVEVFRQAPQRHLTWTKVGDPEPLFQGFTELVDLTFAPDQGGVLLILGSPWKGFRFGVLEPEWEIRELDTYKLQAPRRIRAPRHGDHFGVESQGGRISLWKLSELFRRAE